MPTHNTQLYRYDHIYIIIADFLARTAAHAQNQQIWYSALTIILYTQNLLLLFMFLLEFRAFVLVYVSMKFAKVWL